MAPLSSFVTPDGDLDRLSRLKRLLRRPPEPPESVSTARGEERSRLDVLRSLLRPAITPAPPKQEEPSVLEEAKRRMQRAVLGMTSALARSPETFVRGLGERLGRATAELSKEAREKGVELGGGGSKLATRLLAPAAERLERFAERVEERAARIEIPERETFEPREPRWWLALGADIAPQIAMQVGLAAATGGLSVPLRLAAWAAPIAATEAEQARQRVIARGGSKEEAAGTALMTGLGTTALENLTGAAVLLRRVPGADRIFSRQLAARLANVMRRRGGRLGAVTASEAVEEVAQGALADALVYARTRHPEEFRDWLKRYAAQAAGGALGGAALGAAAEVLPLHATRPQSERGTPAAESSAALAGRPEKISYRSTPSSLQAEPSQVSAVTRPSRATTTRAIRPSTTTGATTTSGRAILQPISDSEELSRRAHELAPQVNALMAELARETSARPVGVRVKDPKRLREKLRRRGADQISDYLGARLALADTDWQAVASALEKRGWKIQDVDDFLREPRPGGYRAVHLQAMDPQGRVSVEFQLVPRELAEVQEEAHRHLEVFQGRTKASAEEVREALERSEALFGSAWQRFQERMRSEEKPAPELSPAPARALPEEVEAQARRAPPQILSAIWGKPSPVRLPRGEPLPARYAVVDADALVTSHDPFTFQKSALYPEGVQERRYHTDRAAQEDVVRIATALNPDILLDPTASPIDGPPVVTPAGIVLSGNSRTMAVRRAYSSGGVVAEAYRQAIRRRAGEFGIEAETLPEKPVLVRIVDLPPETPRFELAEIASRANEPTTKARDILADAATRARRIEESSQADQLLGELALADPEDTLRKWLASGAGGRWVRSLVEANVIRREEAARVFTKDGALTEEGKQVAERTIYALALPDPDVVDLAPAAWLRKLEHATVSVVTAARSPGWDLRPFLVEAMRIGHAVEQSAARDVSDIVMQQDLLGREWSAESVALARFLEGEPKRTVTEAFRQWRRAADEFERYRQSSDIFGYLPEGPKEALLRIFTPALSAEVREPQPIRAAGPLAGTVVTDELGRAIPVYHGTGEVFTEFDPERSDPQALFGPGFYFTEDPEIAGGIVEKGVVRRAGYAIKIRKPVLRDIGARRRLIRRVTADPYFAWIMRPGSGYLTRSEREEVERGLREFERTGNLALMEQLAGQPYNLLVVRNAFVEEGLAGAPQVRVARLAIRRPFDADRLWSEEETTDFLRRVPEDALARAGFTPAAWTAAFWRALENEPRSEDGAVLAGDVYSAMEAAFRTAEGALPSSYPRRLVNELLQAMGFDGITYTGGKIMGSKPHRVWVAFWPTQILPGLWGEEALRLPAAPATRVRRVSERLISPEAILSEAEVAFGSVGAAEAASRELARMSPYTVTLALPDTDAWKQIVERAARAFRWVELRGQVARSTAELAALLRPFRSPAFETLHFLYFDEDWRIIAHEAYSSGSIEGVAVATPVHDTVAFAEKVGARYVAAVHNHPSGNVESSDGDRHFTEYYREHFARLTSGRIGFIGHLIIDRDEYTWIDERLEEKKAPVPPEAYEVDQRLDMPDWLSFERPVMTEPKDLVSLPLKPGPGNFLAVYLGSWQAPEQGYVWTVNHVEPHRWTKDWNATAVTVDNVLSRMGTFAARRVIFVTSESDFELAERDAAHPLAQLREFWTQHGAAGVLDVIGVGPEGRYVSARDVWREVAFLPLSVPKLRRLWPPGTPSEPEADVTRRFLSQRGYPLDALLSPVAAETRSPVPTLGVAEEEPPGLASEEWMALVSRRLAAAKGLPVPRARERLLEAARKLKAAMTRHYPHLDGRRGPKIGAVVDLLRQWEAVPAAAKAEAVELIRSAIADLEPRQVELFTHLLMLPDIVKDIEAGKYEGKALPFGYPNEAAVRQHLAFLEQRAANDPPVTEALRRRAEFAQKLTRELVEEGMLPESVLSDPRFYHRQVLEYALLRGRHFLGLSPVDLRIRRKGFQRARVGGSDFNTLYHEAEFEWVAQAIGILNQKRLQDRIRQLTDVRRDLIAQARATNRQRFAEKLADAGVDPEEVMAPARQAIAAGIRMLEDLAGNGALGVPSGFDDLVEAIRDSAEERAALLADYTPKELREMGLDRSGWADDPRFFAFLAALIEERLPGSAAAASIFRAINARERLIREGLGEDYITWRDLIPEGYTTWELKRPWIAFQALADRVLARIEAEGAAPVSAEDLRTYLRPGWAVEWVVPEEVARTLDQVRAPRPDDFFENLWTTAISGIKAWWLLNPLRALRYNLNNLSGDLDIVLAYNPRILKRAAEAARVIARGMRNAEGLPMKDRELYRRARSLAVIESGMTIAEVPDLAREDIFAALRPDRPALLKRQIQRYWRTVRHYTVWRENVLRYAAWLHFREEVPRHLLEGKRIYGASKREEVDALYDTRAATDEIAAKLSRELIGDYGAISRGGMWLRNRLIPFYSWIEINAPRYWRLFRNLPVEGRRKASTRVGAVATKRALLALGFRAVMLYALVALWNRVMFPDEEREIRRRVRRAHLILGRDPDTGEVRYIHIVGALGDALEWIGLEDLPEEVRELLAGTRSFWDVAADMPKAAVERLLLSWEPFSRTSFELATGRRLYPHIFEPGARLKMRAPFIRDRVEYLTSIVSLDRLYRHVVGKPARRSLGKDLLNQMLTLRVDPAEAAYWEIRDVAARWLEEQNIESAAAEPTRRANALYYYRQAVAWGDRAAERRWLKRYYLLGGTPEGLRASITRAHPLGAVPARYRGLFLDSLRGEDLRLYLLAERWWSRRYGGTRAKEPR